MNVVKAEQQPVAAQLFRAAVSFCVGTARGGYQSGLLPRILKQTSKDAREQ